MKKTTRKNLSISYVVPAMSILLLSLVTPLTYALYCSLFSLDYLVKREFLGLGDYVSLLRNNRIIESSNFTFMIVVVSTAPPVIIGLVPALWTDKKEELLVYLVEMFGLIPWVISVMAVALLWRQLFNGDLGLFNTILRRLGFNPTYVVQSKTLTIIALIFVLVRRLAGYAIIMILASLRRLDTILIEAAKIDGASSLQLLRYIKLPLIKTPILLSTIVLTVSDSVNNAVPKVFTNGGPNGATNVIILYQYNLGFRCYQFGTSAALSIMIMLITSLTIVLYIKLSDYRIQEG